MAQEGSERDSDLPKWVAAVLDEIEDHTVMPDVIASAQRVAVMSSFARTMARAKASAAAILAALRVENRIRCRPPLNDEILEGIAHDVAAAAGRRTT